MEHSRSKHIKTNTVTYPGGVLHALLLLLRRSRCLKAMRRVAAPDPAGGFFPLHK